MSNIHTPERLDGESQAQYRARQRDSRTATRIARTGPVQQPAVSPLDTSRFFLGQHTNDRARNRRSAKAEIGARQYRKQRKALARAARG